MSEPIKERCGNCRFFSEYAKAKGEGLCGRFPPQLIGTGGFLAVNESRWPEVKTGDWCGEWKEDLSK